MAAKSRNVAPSRRRILGTASAALAAGCVSAPRLDTPLMLPGLRNQGNSPARRKQQQMQQVRSNGGQNEWRRGQQRSRAR